MMTPNILNNMKMFKPLTSIFIISFYLLIMIRRISLKNTEVSVSDPTTCFSFYLKTGIVN